MFFLELPLRNYAIFEIEKKAEDTGRTYRMPSRQPLLLCQLGNMTRQDGTRYHVSQGMKRCPGMASTLICSYSPVIKNFFTFFFSRGHLRRWNHELRHWGRRRRALRRRCSSQDRGRRDGCATIAITREFLSRDCSHKAPGKKLKCHAR